MASQHQITTITQRCSSPAAPRLTTRISTTLLPTLCSQIYCHSKTASFVGWRFWKTAFKTWRLPINTRSLHEMNSKWTMRTTGMTKSKRDLARSSTPTLPWLGQPPQQQRRFPHRIMGPLAQPTTVPAIHA